MIFWCRAAELLFTGKKVDVTSAYEFGLLNEVVSSENLMPIVKEYARRVCEAAPLAVTATKSRWLWEAAWAFEEGLRLEGDLQRVLLSTNDFSEGTRVFLEERKPCFKRK